MNAAFLLVTTAWLAGQEAAKPAAPAQPATPAAPAVMAAPGAYGHAPSASYGGCGGGCDAYCEDDCGKGGLFSRLRARFGRKNDCCDTCDTCSTCTTSCNTCTTYYSSCDSCGCDSGCASGRRWGHRLRGLFRRKNDCCDACTSCGCDSSCSTCGYGATVAPPAAAPKGEPIGPPKNMPKGEPAKTSQLLVPQPITPASNVTTIPRTTSPFELSRRYEARVAHAHDYSWVTGQLFFVHADGGLWLLRYAPLSQEDPNGGSVVLARDLSMRSYREGDLVTVRGQIINQHSSKFLGGPLYRAQSIQLVDRGGK